MNEDVPKIRLDLRRPELEAAGVPDVIERLGFPHVFDADDVAGFGGVDGDVDWGHGIPQLGVDWSDVDPDDF